MSGRATKTKERQKTMKLKTALAALAAATSLAVPTSALAAIGEGYDIADINSAGNQAILAYPGTKAFWAGTCDIGTAPDAGEPIPGGVGSRSTKIAFDTPKELFGGITEQFVFENGFGPFPAGTKMWQAAADAPADPPHCIDYGLPNDARNLGELMGNNAPGPGAEGPESWEPTPNSPAGWWTEDAEEPPFEPHWRFAPATEAGAHPDGTTAFAFKRNGATLEGTVAPDGNTDNIGVALPAGFAGDPNAVPKCTGEQFAVKPVQCPPSSQVGVATITLVSPPGFGATTAHYPVYNLEPRQGNLAELGIPDVSTLTSVRVMAKVRTAGDHGVSGWVTQIPAALPLYQQAITLWGVPWAPEHDAWRPQAGFTLGGLPWSGLAAAKQATYDPSWGEVKPFFSNLTGPASRADGCDGAGQEANTRVTTDAFQKPGTFDANGEPNLSDPDWVVADSPSPPLTGCEKVGFAPTIDLKPSTSAADSPSGLEVDLRIPQNDDAPVPAPAEGADQATIDTYLQDALAFWRSDAGRATSHLRDTTVTLPEGMTLNPSAAHGQGACTMAQMGVTDTDSPVPPRVRFDNSPVGCPESSKVAEVVVETPVLDPADYPSGHVYLAKQKDNPFNSDFAIYIALRSPERGLIAKLAGEVLPDPATGRLATTFADNPALPFERFHLRFKGGARAPLATPSTCGAHQSTSSLAPYSDPGDPVVIGEALPVSSSPAGGCPASPAARPLNLGFAAGTTNPLAGAHSPFTARITRPDGAQEIDRVQVTTPEGFAATLRGVARCPEAAIAQAAARTGSGDGALEQASPSCPAASQVGTTTVGAGAGPEPFYVPGRVYLAGPYRGAPLSLAFVVPAVAGPFDLGVQVVRAAASIDPRTAQITTTSDPIPQILRGIPLRIRDIRVEIDRPAFALNPTDCSEQLVSGRVFGSHGAVSELSNRFQADGCARLGFKPALSLRLKGATKRGRYQAVIATLRARPGDANIARASVRMPRSAFLAQEHIRTVCTRVQFAADACPRGSIYGRASATSPLIEETLAGPVYLRSSDNPLPDLVATLKGPQSLPIEVEVSSRTDSVKGALRSTFDVVPDVAVSRFTLRLFGGKRGLIVNSQDLCAKRAHRATVRMAAQNGRTRSFRPKLRNGCKRKQARRAKKRR